MGYHRHPMDFRVRNNPTIGSAGKLVLGILAKLGARGNPVHHLSESPDDWVFPCRDKQPVRRCIDPCIESVSFSDLLTDAINAENSRFLGVVLQAVPKAGTYRKRIVTPMCLDKDICIEQIDSRFFPVQSASSKCRANSSKVLPFNPISE